MNGKRCAIFLGRSTYLHALAGRVSWFVSRWNVAHYSRFSRVFGSHSEAKRELLNWRDEWPDARIVDEKELG